MKKSEIPCKWFSCYTENQSPLGSGEYWPMEMMDCLYEGEGEDDIAFGTSECGPACPHYEPAETEVCEKHGLYVKSAGCLHCADEEEAAFYKSLEEDFPQYARKERDGHSEMGV